MNIQEINDVLYVYFGKKALETMLKVYKTDGDQSFIHLYYDNDIPVIASPSRPNIISVQIMPHAMGKSAVFQVWTRDFYGNTSTNVSELFTQGTDLIKILKQFYPTDVTIPITDAQFIIDAPTREKDAKYRRWLATAKQLRGSDIDAIALINKIITTANANADCDVGEMDRGMFLYYLTENLRKSNIMNDLAIKYPEPKPRPPQE